MDAHGLALSHLRKHGLLSSQWAALHPLCWKRLRREAVGYRYGRDGRFTAEQLAAFHLVHGTMRL